MIYSGIDEAGLGPILGPFCATATTFKAPGDLKEILKDYQKKIFYVDDSKKVYQGKYGFDRLELNVLAFYSLLGKGIPESIKTFIPSLNSSWNIDDIPLPISVSKDKILDTAHQINNIFEANNINILDIKRTAVSPIDFNRLIDIWSNKSIVCQKIMNPLLLSCLNIKSEHQITVDKQGGRKFYKEYLDNLLKTKDTEIILEENNRSFYTKENTDIRFMAKADSNNFEVALSSMFSKYMRELAMLSFNNYWQRKNPDLKATAGYYTDGVRFINELESYGIMPKNRDLIVRKK